MPDPDAGPPLSFEAIGAIRETFVSMARDALDGDREARAAAIDEMTASVLALDAYTVAQTCVNLALRLAAARRDLEAAKAARPAP